MKKNLVFGILTIAAFNFIGVAICTAIDAFNYSALDSTYGFLLLSMIIPIVAYAIYFNIYYKKSYEGGFHMKFGYSVPWWVGGTIGCAAICVLVSFVFMQTGMDTWFCWPIVAVSTLVGMLIACKAFRPAN